MTCCRQLCGYFGPDQVPRKATCGMACCRQHPGYFGPEQIPKKEMWDGTLPSAPWLLWPGTSCQGTHSLHTRPALHLLAASLRFREAFPWHGMKALQSGNPSSRSVQAPSSFCLCHAGYGPDQQAWELVSLSHMTTQGEAAALEEILRLLCGDPAGPATNLPHRLSPELVARLFG